MRKVPKEKEWVATNRVSYILFVKNRIEAFAPGDPIFVSQLGEELSKAYKLAYKKACASAAVAVKQLIDTAAMPNLRHFGKGIYFLAKQTAFGETGINKEKLIEAKYLSDGNGYEAGTFMMHKLGLTAWVPAERVFVSNRVQNRVRTDKALGIVVRPSKVTIDQENRFYLQFLDLLSIYDKIPIDAENPYGILSGIVRTRRLDYGMLLQFADRYYDKNTMIHLAHIAGSEVESVGI